MESEKKYTRADMENCFQAGVKFGRDMSSNPSNSEYLESIDTARTNNIENNNEETNYLYGR